MSPLSELRVDTWELIHGVFIPLTKSVSSLTSSRLRFVESILLRTASSIGKLSYSLSASFDIEANSLTLHVSRLVQLKVSSAFNRDGCNSSFLSKLSFKLTESNLFRVNVSELFRASRKLQMNSITRQWQFVTGLFCASRKLQRNSIARKRQ